MMTSSSSAPPQLPLPANPVASSSGGRRSPASAQRCWRRVKCLGDIPGPRSGAASVIVGNRMFMFGGYGGSGRLDDFYEFNFETKVWSKVRYNGPSPGVRENNGVVEYKGCLYLFGGK